jgi:hypothetical protein
MTSRMRECVILFSLLSLAGCFQAEGKTTVQSSAKEHLIIASGGSAHYAIVVTENPSPAEQLAADELQKYLQRITGAAFTETGRLRGPSIVVCTIDSLGKVSPRLKPPVLASEGFCLVRNDENLYLIGADQRSVLYAVYDFLDRLGCKWLAPNYDFYAGYSEFVPRKSELIYVHRPDVIEKPAMKYRKLQVEEAYSHTTHTLLQMIDWMPKLRFNTLVVPVDYQGCGYVRWDFWRDKLTPELKKRGITIEVGGHGYNIFINPNMESGTLFDKHPEWFAMDKDGKRSRREYRVFCTSNPDAVAYFHRNILNYLKNRPEIGMFYSLPPEEDWCECPNCRALGSISDRHAILVNQTARLLGKEIPGMKLVCEAYSYFENPPDTETIDKNVLVEMAPFLQNFESQIYEPDAKYNREFSDRVRRWAKSFKGDIGLSSYFRKYMWRSLPVVIPTYIQKDIQFYRNVGAEGALIFTEPNDWFTYELNYYTLGKVTWNPDVDMESTVDESLLARYGPSIQTARVAYKTLEAVVRHACDIPETTLKTPEEYDRYSEQINSSISHVKTARDKCAGDRRLSIALRRLELMLNYAESNIELQRLRAAKAPEAQIKAKMEHIKAFISENRNDGVFLMNYYTFVGTNEGVSQDSWLEWLKAYLKTHPPS